jgi:hypothetical protein
MECPLLLRCKTSVKHCPVSAPLMGSQQPFDGLFSPMEVRTNHLSMCTGPNGTCPSGMVLHIKNYALHGIIIHRDHSNVNHISSLILSNICIKILIYHSIAQRIYKTYNTRLRKRTRYPIGLVSIRKGKFPRGFIQAM